MHPADGAAPTGRRRPLWTRRPAPAVATGAGVRPTCHAVRAAPCPASMLPLATIGYEGATVERFLDALRAADVDLLVDVRAVARSRRPGFAKTRLAAHVGEAGIGYLHLRGLGTPAEGRAAAHAGEHGVMRAVFAEHLATPGAQADLAALADLVGAGRRVCLLCFEADPAHCHRSLVADALGALLPVHVAHLAP